MIRVRANNSHFQDVAPLSGDFTMCGGIYRPAGLIVTDGVCISPLDHASSGVYLTFRSSPPARPMVEVRTLVSNGLAEWPACRWKWRSPMPPARLSRRAAKIPVAAGQTATVAQTVRIAHPHRWQGRKDPYLYTATVRLHRDGRVVDSVTQPLGLRTIEIAPDRGVLLNGEPYAVHGVNRHQDRLNKGWALTAQDHEEDIRLILDLGCTGLRLAHYQQSSVVHDLCDRGGLLVWQEVPLVERISGLPEFAENAKQQLTEMILQGYNHPSLCFWGLFNELNATWVEQSGPDAGPADHGAARTGARAGCHAGRPSQLPGCVSRPRSTRLPDQIAFNVYPGWYWGTPDDYGHLFTDLSTMMGGRRVGISEYGAGRQHSAASGGSACGAEKHGHAISPRGMAGDRPRTGMGLREGQSASLGHVRLGDVRFRLGQARRGRRARAQRQGAGHRRPPGEEGRVLFLPGQLDGGSPWSISLRAG